MRKKWMRILACMLCALAVMIPALAETLSLPEDLCEIGAEAFMGAQSLGHVELPEDVKSIGSRAFAGSSVSTIYLPAGVETIAPDAFEGCDVTAQVIPGSYAEAFCADNGVKYEILSTPAEAFAYKEQSGGIVITGYTGESARVVIPSEIDGLSVTTIGAKAFSGNKQIEFVAVPDSVTKIDTDAFSGCTALRTAILGKGVDMIGMYAFENCTALENVTMPTALTTMERQAFANCDSLKEITLNEGLKLIGFSAFEGCDKLETIHIPDSVETICAEVFADCVSLKEFDYPMNWKEAKSSGSSYDLFRGCESLKEITVPEGATAVPRGAFAGSNCLENIVLPSTLTTLNESAFAGCTKLTEIEIPEGVESIGMYVFRNCTALENVTMPTALTTMEREAFANCDSLKEMTLNDGLLIIGFSAFEGCDRLETIHIPDSVETICADAFKDCISLKEFDYPMNWTEAKSSGSSYDLFRGCESLKEITVPEGIAVVPKGAFAGSDCLENIVLPSTLTTLDESAFAGCTKLTEIELPEGVETIGMYAFENCTGLENVTMPTALTTLERQAFANCDSLTELTFEDGLLVISYAAFEGCDNLEYIHLPDSVEIIRAEAFKDCVSLKEFDYPMNWTEATFDWTSFELFRGCASLTEIVVPEGVVTMPVGAFAGSDCLVKVTLPSTLKSLSESAFADCPNLVEIEIPEGVESIGMYAFENCTLLPNLKMPSTLMTLERQAFADCDSFTEITFEDGLMVIGFAAFEGCDNVEYIHLPDSVEIIRADAFKDCVSLKEFDYPMNWTEATSDWTSFELFRGCASLTEIVVPEGVVTMPVGAFAGSDCLVKVTLPSTLKSLSESAFADCPNLVEIEIPEGVESIGMYAFENCTLLPNLKMPSTLMTLERQAFADCDSFTEITFEDGLMVIGFAAFEGCDNVEYIHLPDSVEIIRADAFKDCVSLKEFDYPMNWTEATSDWSDYDLFRGCESLKEIVVPEGIEVMPDGAFAGGNCIERVILPSTLRNISTRSFEGCSALTDCHIPYGVRNIHWLAFGGCSALRDLYIPTSVVDFGDAEKWREVFTDCDEALILESEYGAVPIRYAAGFDLNYYYLSYTGRNVPKGTVYKGDVFNITGFARSTLPLTDVHAVICDADGNVVREMQVEPGVTDYSLNDISEALSVGALELGKYTFTLSAATEKSAETFVRTSFTVAPPPLRVYLRNYEPFSGYLAEDSDAVLSGTVSANYPITSLTVRFIPGEEGTAVEFTAAPNAKRFDLSSLNIAASSLEPGAYEMRIIVSGNGETKTVGHRSYSLTTDAIPEDFTVDYDALTAFLADADNRNLFDEYTVDYTMEIEANMTAAERFNLVMSQRKDYTNATIRDTLDEMLAGVDDADTYLIELYKKEIADFIVDLGSKAAAYEYDDAMMKALADSIRKNYKIDFDFIGSEYGEISETDMLMLKAMGKKLDAVGDVADYMETADELAEIVTRFYEDYSRGIEIMEYLSAEYVGNEQYQYALEELKCEYFSNSYRAFNDVFTYAYKEAVKDATKQVTSLVLKALSAEVYAVYEVVSFAETVLDKVFDIYGDSNDFVTYSVQCATYQNARAAFRNAFDAAAAAPDTVGSIVKLKRSFEVTRLSAIRALETLMVIKECPDINYTYPTVHLRALRKLEIGF